MQSGQAWSRQGSDKIRNCLYSKGRINPKVRTLLWPCVSDCQDGLIFAKCGSVITLLWVAVHPTNQTQPLSSRLILFCSHHFHSKRVKGCPYLYVCGKNLSNVLPAPLYSVFQCFKSLGQIKEKTGLHVKVANVWVHWRKCLASLQSTCP